MTRKLNRTIVALLLGTGLIPAAAHADLIGSTLGWQYYGGGGAYNPDSGGSQTSGVFVDNGGIGGTFIEPGAVEVFDIVADDTSITFDYSVDTTVGPWSPSPLSLSPTIYNGIAIDLLSAGSFASVSIDPATNMTGFGAGDLSFTGNQIEVNWEDLPFTTSTVVTPDVALAESAAHRNRRHIVSWSDLDCFRSPRAAPASATGAHRFASIALKKPGGPQARRVVSSRQLSARSATSREASVKAMTPTAARLSPRWLQ